MTEGGFCMHLGLTFGCTALFISPWLLNLSRGLVHLRRVVLVVWDSRLRQSGEELFQGIGSKHRSVFRGSR